MIVQEETIHTRIKDRFLRRAVFLLRKNARFCSRWSQKRCNSKKGGNMTEVKKEKKKPGRPKKAVTRQRTTGIRFTKAEHYVIKHKAQLVGLKLTAYIRQMAVEGQVITRLNEEETSFIRHLIGISNNINQVAKACHEQGTLRAVQYFEEYRNRIDALLKKLRV